ncbi:unnamed protein product [Adineta ricciae]|uniref:Uncharacterized protein n=1 Tax=Adineta ricciae TaxID=249248 RepID=A0A814V5Y5_ADIRI|nr:unnamed protein product [Adineta ricciae]
MMLRVLCINLMFIFFISSLNGSCIQFQCTLAEIGSTCCYNLGCCPAKSNVCCPNDPTNCCTKDFPVCCATRKGCCPKRYPVCCSTQCCSSGSYCCGEKCCRRDTITGRLFEIPDGITKSNRYRQMMLKTHAN